MKTAFAYAVRRGQLEGDRVPRICEGHLETKGEGGGRHD